MPDDFYSRHRLNVGSRYLAHHRTADLSDECHDPPYCHRGCRHRSCECVCHQSFGWGW